MSLSVEAEAEASSPVPFNKESLSSASPSPLISRSSDKRFWSDLNQRFESRKVNLRASIPAINNNQSQDALLLNKAFDSVANSLSLLTANLQSALQGAREVAKQSTPLTEIIHSSNAVDTEIEAVEDNNKQEEKSSGDDDNKRGIKRKLDAQDCSENQGDDEEEKEISDNKKKQKQQVDINHLKKIKDLAVTMAIKSASLARELKSVRSEMCFLQEKCALLEEKNQKLQDGFDKGVRPDEDDDDDLVRLQLEALLAEKSRLATENASLTRENQCLRQLVEYHQFASEDLSASYEQVIQGISLDFSSPIAQDDEESLEDDPKTPPGASREAFDFEFPACLGKSFDDL